MDEYQQYIQPCLTKIKLEVMQRPDFKLLQNFKNWSNETTSQIYLDITKFTMLRLDILKR